MRRLASPAEAAGVLRGGGVVLMPTDTLPGLHCRADLAAAVARLSALKGRDAGRPLLLLCADADQALALASDVDDRIRYYVETCWPGPFTLVLKAGPRAPAAVLAGRPTVALRVPGAVWLRGLVDEAGGPLASTSANRSGETPPRGLAEAVARFGEAVDGVLATAAGAGPAVGSGAGGDGTGTGRASALLDLTVRPARILREGPRVPPPEPRESDGESGDGAAT